MDEDKVARHPRYVLPGYPQHVIQRGNNRGVIFNEEEDYLFYLEKLLLASQEHGCEIHAYVLMTNHVHLLVTPRHELSIGKMQQMLGRYYVRYFNDRNRRTGTLWEGRYKATLVDHDEYLFTCMRYIELNPVRAKMVSHPAAYRWSSYHYNAMGKADTLLKPHHEYNALGKIPLERQKNYLSLFDSALSIEQMNHIREMTNKGWVLGSQYFKQNIQEQINRPLEAKLRGGDHRSESFQAKTNRV